jgi:hypothetical protein
MYLTIFIVLGGIQIGISSLYEGCSVELCPKNQLEMDSTGKFWPRYCYSCPECSICEDELVFMKDYEANAWEYRTTENDHYQGRVLLDITPCEGPEIDSIGHTWTTWCYGGKKINFEKIGNSPWVYKQDYAGGYPHLQFRKILDDDVFSHIPAPKNTSETPKVHKSLYPWTSHVLNTYNILKNTPDKSKYIMQLQLQSYQNYSIETNNPIDFTNKNTQNNTQGALKTVKNSALNLKDVILDKNASNYRNGKGVVDDGNPQYDKKINYSEMTITQATKNTKGLRDLEKFKNDTRNVISDDIKQKILSTQSLNPESEAQKNKTNTGNKVSDGQDFKSPESNSSSNLSELLPNEPSRDHVASFSNPKASASKRFSSPLDLKTNSSGSTSLADASNPKTQAATTPEKPMIHPDLLHHSYILDSLNQPLNSSKCNKLEGDRSGRYFYVEYSVPGRKIVYDLDPNKNFIYDPSTQSRVSKDFSGIPIAQPKTNPCKIYNAQGIRIELEPDIYIKDLFWEKVFDNNTRVKYLKRNSRESKKQGMYLIDSSTGYRFRSFV